MGAVLLRAQVCLNCGGAMPTGARIDQRYCKESCRTLAYRIRKRSGLPARPRTAVPQWVDGQPPTIASALAALAELQARVLHIAHHIEQDDIAFRQACPTGEREQEQPPAKDTTPLQARIAELEQELAQARRALEQAQDDQGATAREVQRLEAARKADQAALAEAQQQVKVAEARQYELDDLYRTQREISRERFGQIQELTRQLEEAQSSPQRRGGKVSPGRKAVRPEPMPAPTPPAPAPATPDPALMRKLGQLEGENRTLQGMVQSQADLQGTAQDLFGYGAELSAQSQQLQTELVRMRQTMAASNAEVAKLRAESLRVEPLRETIRDQKAQLSQAARDHRALQAEVQRLQPPPHETDPFTLRMRDCVLLSHRIAEMQQEANRRGIGPLYHLPLDIPLKLLNVADDRAVWAAAIQMATTVRRNFVSQPPFGVAKPTWVHVDRLLDPQGEADVLKYLQGQMSTMATAEQLGRMRLRSGRHR